MPDLKTRTLFISHAWKYDEHYDTVEKWLNGAIFFSWKNCSVPHTNPLLFETTADLEKGITRQISCAQGVIILAGMYAAHSGWIDYEIDEALRMKKTIIAVRPWGQERMPVKVQNAANINGNVLVNWQSASVVEAVRTYI